MAADTLYEDDIVAWAEQQAKAIRERARVRADLSNLLDWENIAEEIEDVGRNYVHQFSNLTLQFMIHVIKALSVRNSPALPHWRTECLAFHDDATERFTPSMRQKIDLDRLWLRARRLATSSLAEHGDEPASDITDICPLTLDEFIDPELDLDRAVSIAATRLGRVSRSTETLS